MQGPPSFLIRPNTLGIFQPFLANEVKKPRVMQIQSKKEDRENRSVYFLLLRIIHVEAKSLFSQNSKKRELFLLVRLENFVLDKSSLQA